MFQNIIDKIWKSHTVHQEAGSPDIIFIDLQLLHEVTSPQAFSALKKNNLNIFDNDRNIATIDHSIPTNPTQDDFADEQNKTQIETLRKNCQEFDISLHDIGSGNQGVVHVTGPELGITQPGMTICCGDSHTSTHGAFGALAFGVGTTQIFHILATSSLLLKKPKTMKVNFVGTPNKYFSAKDAILALIKQIGVQGGTGFALEYCGEFIKNCSMEERMTICNMSIECGARSGLISPDETTFEWIKNTEKVPEEKFEEAVKKWKEFASDSSASYDKEIEVNIQDMKPLVTWGTTPEQGVCVDENIPEYSEMSASEKVLAEKSLDYTKLTAGQAIKGTEIQNVFVGSCTNGRLSDLKTVAEVLQRRKVKEGVRVFIVPGSEKVEQQAKELGLDKIFTVAGADFRRPGCSMCLAMNGDNVPAGERCVSTSNRNFIGRQGEGAITHLASPLMAAIAAVTGKITDPEEFFAE
jgi:3-isopropylmalate/(R)-2-methylmalate dehydratase large subunit